MSNWIPRVEFGLQALVLRQRTCPFCRTRNHAVVARKHGLIRIRQCRDCSLYFTDPIYRSRLGELYDLLYAAEGSTTTVPTEEQLQNLKANNFASSDKYCSAQIAALRRLGVGQRLLEIGSSWGYFLYQAQTAGFSPVGVELGTHRRNFGVQKLGVRICASLDEVSDLAADVIYSAHTLEHLCEVDRFFTECHRCLCPGGVLVIEVPHFDIEASRSRALTIIGAIHPLGLTPQFFMSVLPQTGFRTIGIFDTWEAVPSRPQVSNVGKNLIVVAQKLPATNARRPFQGGLR